MQLSLRQNSMIAKKIAFNELFNLIIIVDVQRLHENGKLISYVSNGVYTLSKKSFLADPQCFIKLPYFINSRV